MMRKRFFRSVSMPAAPAPGSLIRLAGPVAAALLALHSFGVSALARQGAPPAARPAVPDPAWAETQLTQRRFLTSSLDALTTLYNCGHVTQAQLFRARRMALIARSELRGSSRRAVPANLAYNAYARETEAGGRTHAASNACVRPRA